MAVQVFCLFVSCLWWSTNFLWFVICLWGRGSICCYVSSIQTEKQKV